MVRLLMVSTKLYKECIILKDVQKVSYRWRLYKRDELHSFLLFLIDNENATKIIKIKTVHKCIIGQMGTVVQKSEFVCWLKSMDYLNSWVKIVYCAYKIQNL